LKCHFGGFAVQIPAAGTGSVKPVPHANPDEIKYDIEATLEAFYKAASAEAFNKYGESTTGQVAVQRPSGVTNKLDLPASNARKKLVELLKTSPGVYDVGDLPSVNHSVDHAATNTFSPIFFAYSRPIPGQPANVPGAKTPVSKFNFVYDGRLLLVGAFCGKYQEIPALEETVSKVCLLMSKSGFEFRCFPPTPARQSLDAGIVSTALTTTSGAFNDSVGGPGTMTRMFMSKPYTVQEVLRSLYAASFPYLTSFYSLREESNLKDALIQTIEAHSGTIRGLVEEYGKTGGSRFLRRRKLRGLVRFHCSKLKEKIGRLDALSDALAKGIDSLDKKLQDEPLLRTMLEGEPGWKSYIRHDFDTQSKLDLISWANNELKGNRMRSVIILVAILAAVAGGIVGFMLGRIF
jgi:hypothetical protein